MLEKIKRIYRRYFKDVPIVKIKLKKKIERHGSIYGGWNVIENSLGKDSIVYSIGIGQDISFDLSIIEKYKCKVHAYDPTSKVKSWLSQQNLPIEFLFNPIALSDKEGTIKFYPPKDKNHISYSTSNSNQTKDDFTLVECSTLQNLMKINEHQSIDLLKMDIEGEELKVIDFIIKNDIKISQLLIEFHHFFPDSSTKETEKYIHRLENAGYRLFSISDSFCEFSFFRP